MPLIATRGAASAQGFGEFAQSGSAPVYVEDVFSTYVWNGTSTTQYINNGVTLGTAISPSLQNLPITVISGNFVEPYVIGFINDGLAPSDNSNFSYSNTTFDVYVTFPTAVALTAYQLAPQGVTNNPYNTPLNFSVLASNDASSWTTVATFTSITTGFPAWNPGTYRTFSFSNTTAYKYWRLQITGTGSGASGNSLAEWRVTGTALSTGGGGLAWIKNRDSTYEHILVDTVRGTSAGYLTTAYNYAQSGSTYGITAFNSNGFTLNTDNAVNQSGRTYVGWTFKEQPKFFDVVTYTGNGVYYTPISHNLGSVPGCIIVKKTSGTADWMVYHRSLSGNGYIRLNLVDGEFSSNSVFPAGGVNATAFNVGSDSRVNENGATYVAYLFAHNAGGFGALGTDNVISCGSYSGNGTGTGPTITLGYEPQWLLIKNITDYGYDWYICDNIRGTPWGTSPSSGVPFQSLRPNLINAEASQLGVNLMATGFQPTNSSTAINGAGSTYIYIAIRRGPMRTPATPQSVFLPAYVNSGYTVQYTNFPVDFCLQAATTGSTPYSPAVQDRLRSPVSVRTLSTSDANSESNSGASPGFQSNTTFYPALWGASYGSMVESLFKRAPGFMDMVAYAGTGSATTQAHNLGVAPELLIVRSYNNSTNWFTYSSFAAANRRLFVDKDWGYNDANTTDATIWNNTAPTATQFSIGGSANISGWSYVAYMFATLPGISKFGSYTGTGGTQTINCGFTAGARFVLIKRTDSTGNWFCFNSAAGMTGADSPYIRINLNTTGMTTGYNGLQAVSSGFQLDSTASGTVNINGATYIFLAIA